MQNDLQTKLQLARQSGYSDQEVQSYLKSRASTNQQPKRSSWLTAIPSIAAAGASFIPGVGTAGAVALGGGGELARQLLSGEKVNLGNVGKEAALSAVPGGLGKIGKFAVKGIRGGATAANTAGAVKNTETMLSSAGQKLRASNRGIQAGDKIGKEILDENRAKELNNAVNDANKGLTGRTVRGQVKGVQQAKQAAADELNAAAKASKGVVAPETKAKISKGVATDRDKILTFDPANKAHIDLNNRYAKRLDSANSAEQVLEARRVFGQAAKKVYANPDATQTLDKELASVYYNHANKMLDDLAPEVRAADKKFSTLSDAEKALTSNKSKVSATGVKPLGTSINGRGIGGGTFQAATDTAGKVLEAAGSNKTVPKFARGLTGQVATRIAAAPLTASAAAPPADPSAAVEGGVLPTGTEIPTSAPDTSQTSSAGISEALQTAMLQALAKGDYQGITAIKSVMDTFATQSKPIKKTEGQRARDEAAQLTDKALNQLNAGSVKTGYLSTKIEGAKGFFGNEDPETQAFNVTVDSLKAAIAKARAGTSFTPNEEKLLNKYAPTSGDSGQQLRTKLQALQGIYGQAAQREYGIEYQPDNQQLIAQGA